LDKTLSTVKVLAVEPSFMNRLLCLVLGRTPAVAAAWLAGLAVQHAQAQTAASDSGSPSNAAPRAISLADARRIAFEQNWDLLAAKSGVDLATAQLLAAKEFPNPTASWSTFRIGSHANGTDMGNGVWERSYDTIATISQLFEIAGKRHSRQAAARAGIQGARARFHDAKRTLDQGVTKAYMTALLAAENARILNQSSGYLQHEAEIAENRFKAGDISDSDRKQIEIDAGQFELQAKAAEAAAVQARVGVEVLMGIKQPDGNWSAVDSLESLVPTGPPSPGVRPGPGAARSDVLAAEADLRSAEANVKLQKALRVPDPTVSVGEEHNPPGGNPPVDTVNVGVSFPLPLWNHNRGNIKAAEATADQSRIALARAHAQVASDIANAEVGYREAQARWLRYQNDLGPKSTKVRESVAFAFEKGGASLLNLLEAERTDNDIRLATAQAMSDTASAVADLIAAKSVLSEAELNPGK
jgi:outer membrane protein, heavy metal efflux system